MVTYSLSLVIFSLFALRFTVNSQKFSIFHLWCLSFFSLLHLLLIFIFTIHQCKIRLANDITNSDLCDSIIALFISSSSSIASSLSFKTSLADKINCYFDKSRICYIIFSSSSMLYFLYFSSNSDS
jgi:hypothetical protein